MSWYDWLLIAVLLLGMVVRVIGRSIRAHANLKYGNDPDRKEKQVRPGTTLQLDWRRNIDSNSNWAIDSSFNNGLERYLQSD